MLLAMMCIFVGFVTSYPFFLEQFKGIAKYRPIFDRLNENKSYIGLVSMGIGLWYFISPTESERYWGNLDFIGDLIPSLLCIVVGFFLSQKVLLNYINFSDEEERSKERQLRFGIILEKYGVNLGLGTFLFGIIHIIDVVGGGYPLI